jgi:site-specific DNA-methyltransferase (adenine-specific)
VRGRPRTGRTPPEHAPNGVAGHGIAANGRAGVDRATNGRPLGEQAANGLGEQAPNGHAEHGARSNGVATNGRHDGLVLARATGTAAPSMPAAAHPSPAGMEGATCAPFYADDLVAIYNRDSADLSFLPPASVGLVVTSPPYNLGKDYGTARDDATYHAYLDWVERWGRELLRVLEPGGRLCLNIPLDVNLKFDERGKRGTHKQPVLSDFTRLFVNDLGYVYNTTIMWLENNVSRRTAWGSWLSASDPWVNTAAEAILVLSKECRRRSGRGKTSDITRDEFMKSTLGIWDFHGENTRRFGHPAPFPEALPYRLIRLFSFREDVVLDPFLGSGTTCRVAKDLGRRSIGVEIDPTYCAQAADRCAPPPRPRPPDR